MNKKIIIFAVIILILIIGGIFWWASKETEMYAPPEDYIIKETSEGKFIENKKDGLKARVPNGWGAWKANDITEASGEIIRIFSPDFRPELSPPEGGQIEISIARNSESLLWNADLVREYIAGCQQYPEEMKNFGGEHYETIEIAGHQALKKIDLIESDKLTAIGIQNYISIRIPIDNKVYFFDTLFDSQNPERYIEEFNEFLKTVSITK